MFRIVTATIAVEPGRISVSPQTVLTSHCVSAAAGFAGASTPTASNRPARTPSARRETRRLGAAAHFRALIDFMLIFAASPMPVGRVSVLMLLVLLTLLVAPVVFL